MKRILLIDDHEIVRDGIKKIFDEQAPHTTVFGEASTAQESLRLVREKTWDIVVLDLSLGGRSGLEVLKELKQNSPRLPVLILSMHSEEQYARRAFKAGADGYVTKDVPRNQLFEIITKLLKGGKYISPSLAESLIFDLGKGTDKAPQESLSDREFEIMRLIASGKTVSQIANVLSLSVTTISTYRARVLEKMGMKTNAELTRYAISNNLV